MGIGSGTHSLLSWELDQPAADIVEQGAQPGCPIVMRNAPDGRHLAIGYGRWKYPLAVEYSVSVWSLDKTTPERRMNGPQEPVVDLAFSPSGKRVAAASVDRRLYVWEFDTAALVYSVELPARNVQFLDEKELIVGVGDRLVVLAAEDGAILRETRFPGWVAGFAVTPDRSRALVAASDGSIHRVRLADMIKEFSRIALENPSNLLIDLSSDDALLVLATDAESRILLIDSHSLETLARLPAKDKKTRDVEFDPNGRYLALTGSVVTLWDLELVRGELRRIGIDFHRGSSEVH